MSLWSVWLMLFVAALIPGSIFGYLLVRLPVKFSWVLFFAAYLAALGSYLLSLAIVPAEHATPRVHGMNILLFAPPIFAATFFCICWIRGKKAPPPPSG